jgi:hypothetical protein
MDDCLCKRMLAVNVLLEVPEDIPDGLEAELYAYRDRLQAEALSLRMKHVRSDCSEYALAPALGRPALAGRWAGPLLRRSGGLLRLREVPVLSERPAEEPAAIPARGDSGCGEPFSADDVGEPVDRRAEPRAEPCGEDFLPQLVHERRLHCGFAVAEQEDGLPPGVGGALHLDQGRMPAVRALG